MTKWLLGLLALALAIGWGVEWQRRNAETALLQDQFRETKAQVEALKKAKRRGQSPVPLANRPRPESGQPAPRLPFPVPPPAHGENAMPVFPSTVSPSAPKEMPAPSGPTTMPVGEVMKEFPTTTNSIPFPAPLPGGSPTPMPGGNNE